MEQPHKTRLDLRGVSCPMNFVRTKLMLDKLPGGAILEVRLDAGEPLESVCASVQAEGHELLKCEACDGFYVVEIRKCEGIDIAK